VYKPKSKACKCAVEMHMNANMYQKPIVSHGDSYKTHLDSLSTGVKASGWTLFYNNDDTSQQNLPPVSR